MNNCNICRFIYTNKAVIENNKSEITKNCTYNESKLQANRYRKNKVIAKKDLFLHGFISVVVDSNETHKVVNNKNAYTLAHGFTLIELLVVVAIIAVLVSILLPSLQMARELTKQVSCASNLKQAGAGLFMYREDNYQYFAPMYGTPSDGQLRAFPFFLRPYTGGRYTIKNIPHWGNVICCTPSLDVGKSGYHLFYCPGEPLYYYPQDYQYPLREHAWLKGPWWDACICTYNMLSSLGYNMNITKESNPWLCPKRELLYPARTLVYIDGNNQPRIDHSFRFSAKMRHRGMANMLMGDGHVECINYDNLIYKLTYDSCFMLYPPLQYAE